MDASEYVVSLVTAFAWSVALLVVLAAWIRLSPPKRQGILKRFGGVSVLAPFLMTILTEDRMVLTSPLIGMTIGLLGILVFGVADDVFRLGWRIQLLFQVALAVFVFSFGMRILSVPLPFFGSVFLESLPCGEWIGFALLVLWIVLLMNVLNWADGVDGLLPGITLVSSMVLFFLSLLPHVNQPALGILSMALFGSVLGLFLFNFPPARVFSGTAGSFGIGFALACISVISGTKIATALLTLAIPTIDAIWVVGERLRAGASPFHGGDFRHLHYRLRDIGWSDRRIALSYATVTACIGTTALLADAFGKLLLFLVTVVGIGTILIIIPKLPASFK